MIDQFMDSPQVENMTMLSRSTIYRLEKKGDFPKRRRVFNRTVRWVRSEILEWMASRETI
ncbi:MAG: hypothetical protein COA86_18335 [Kangiella sp.]|nr:MAG: hypothetical protein COA86_18335 [Kangiella sp.]